MLNLKYNFLSFCSCLINAFNTIILLKIFKVSEYSDAYLVAYSIINVVRFLQISFVEQLPYFYNELKLKSIKRAHELASFSVMLAIVIGITSFLLVKYCLSKFLFQLFVSNSDPFRLNSLKQVFSIIQIALLTMPLSRVLEGLAISEHRISIVYCSQITCSSFVSFALIWCLLAQQKSIEIIALGAGIGMLVGYPVGLIYVFSRSRIKFSFRVKDSLMVPFIRNSLATRFGLNLYEALFLIVTNHVLTSFPVGYPSYFHYNYRLLSAVEGAMIRPSLSILNSKLSWLIPQKKYGDAIQSVIKYLKLTTGTFIGVSAFIYLILPSALQLISSNSFNINKLTMMKNLYLSISLWFVVLIAYLGVSAVPLALKRSRWIIASNSLFMGIYIVLIIVSKQYIGMYVFGTAALIAQICSLILILMFLYKYEKLFLEFMKLKKGVDSHEKTFS